jgi:hypothetical protein
MSCLKKPPMFVALLRTSDFIELLSLRNFHGLLLMKNFAFFQKASGGSVEKKTN